MDYKQKLIEWNSTAKYKKELLFLDNLLSCSFEYGDILDYGCGIGTAMKFLYADGYDINDYFIGDSEKRRRYYLNVLPDKKYQYVYFLHSFAHIPNPKDVLRILRGKYPEATLTVITPNLDWLDKDYVGDETVIKHYNQKELKELFEECGYEVTLIGQFGEYKNGQNERIFLQAHAKS